MLSTSEKSFAQRYTKARDLVEYMDQLPGYSPGVTALEAPDLTKLTIELFINSCLIFNLIFFLFTIVKIK